MRRLIIGLMLVSVSWRVSFTVGDLTRFYDMKRTFESLKEAKRFISFSPVGSYECESSQFGQSGSCVLSDFVVSVR
jgi:hypothetical protein